MGDLIDDWMRRGSWLLDDACDAVSATLVLFVFGTVLLALASERMDKLELEVAARPARTFALGLLGSIAAVVLLVTLCVTVIGIPVAAVGALVGAFVAYAGVVAVLRTIGALLIRHRTPNRYLHFAFGCGLFLLASSVPWLGDYVTLTVVLFGIGAVIGSRAAGLWPRAKSNGFAPA